MASKGLLEWKILAALFAVLIVASSAFLGNTDIGGSLFNSTGGGMGGWENPFGSLFTKPQDENGSNAVAIDIYAGKVRLDFLSPVNITTGVSQIANFAGSAEFDFETNTTLFIQSGSDMTIMKATENTRISGAAMKNIILESADYTVSSGDSNTTATADRIEIDDFAGVVEVSGNLRLEGTVSSVSNGEWSIG